MKTIRPITVTQDSFGSFSRASTATYFNEDGVLSTAAIDEPRFNYNPSTLSPAGFLAEPSSTNLLTYSEQFDNAAWTKLQATITPNAAIAPDGTLTADKLIESAAAGQHYIAQSVSVQSNASYAPSVFVKAAERTKCRVIVAGVDWSSSSVVDIDLTNGTLLYSAGTVYVVPVGNGWYRVSIVGVTGSTAAFRGILVLLLDDAGNLSYTGDGTSGIYIWGAQLEAGSQPTSYIKTESAAVTRAADVLTDKFIISTAVNAEADWNSGTTYSLGQISTYSGKRWESLQNTNLNRTPTTSPTWWLDLGADNKHAMFDGVVSTSTTATTKLVTAFAPNETFDSLALININASVVNIVVTDGANGPIVYEATAGLSTDTISNWYGYFFYDPILKRSQIIFYGIPPHPNAYVTLTFQNGEGVDLSVSTLVYGTIFDIGITQYGASAGIVDYSVKETDDFGNTTFIPRAFSKRLNAQVVVENSKINRVQSILYALRATPAVWIASDDPIYEEALVIYGWYRDFSNEISYPTFSLLSIELESLT